jgi:hypothetical protein
MKIITLAVSIEGARNGRIIVKNILLGLAPQVAAASIVSVGNLRIAIPVIMITTGIPIKELITPSVIQVPSMPIKRVMMKKPMPSKIGGMAKGRLLKNVKSLDTSALKKNFLDNTIATPTGTAMMIDKNDSFRLLNKALIHSLLVNKPTKKSKLSLSGGKTNELPAPNAETITTTTGSNISKNNSSMVNQYLIKHLFLGYVWRRNTRRVL